MDAVKRAEDCEHAAVKVEFEREAAQGLSVAEIRARWPRFWGNCPDCGQLLIKYASVEHFVMGDW